MESTQFGQDSAQKCTDISKNNLNNATKSVNNNNTCQICEQSDWKYKCPGCDTRTCSLDCCNTHKEQKNCNGKRKRSTYVPMNQFSDDLIVKDYKFLQETVDTKERAKRCKTQNRYWRANKHLKNLARNKGIDLHFMPAESTKRKQNTTRWKGEKILWKTTWKFFQINHKEITFKKNIDEDEILTNWLKKVNLQPTNINEEQHKIDFLQVENYCIALVYYKRGAEGEVINEDQQCLEVQKEWSLKQALAGNTIVEHFQIRL
eukprot:TRINITY_DN16719_c0_g2_i2.p1 TRINITY_DN16719_c0_g2~~TRINITY_DN16719_c0_g2_i2.p1  ORF type:complete len:261 (-),score=23.25 TRINITY_DN16719_c0_g2_i2:62-844(-)